jgi:sugar lactone lactonase YvrE
MLAPRLEDASVIEGRTKLVSPLRSVFGESAIWSESDGGIWSVDMHGHSIVLTTPRGESRLWKTPGPFLPWARALVLRDGGGLIAALSDRLYIFDPSTGDFTDLNINVSLPDGHLFNDATVDATGRLIIGTMLPGRGNDGKACFFSIGPDHNARLLFEGYNTTNGLAFSPDGLTFYFSDSHVDSRKVWASDYNPSTGTTGSPRLFIDFKDLPGKPDGAAIDCEGGYWLAAMASPFVHRFTAEGQLDRSYFLPLDTPTRPAFGGDGLATLYLTTGGLKSGESDDGLKGGLLSVETGFSGVSANLCCL